MAGIEELHQGAVVVALAKPPRGEAKVRPLVVLSDQILLSRPIVCVAVSTSVSPDDPAAIELPWSPKWRVATGLRRRSFAVCNWLVAIDPTEVRQVKGFVPTKKLLQIVRLVNDLTGR